MTAVYFTTITCKPNTANRHIENLSFFLGGGGGEFVHVPTTFCMLGLEFLELCCVFL